MSLSLVDKQFLRSVADLVVNKPALAKKFFNSPNIIVMDMFEPLKELIDYLNIHDGIVQPDELSRLIDNITDKE
ncbi:TPA: hypothetical protein ACGF3Z_003612, partial [Vibrio cholerae]